MGYLQDQIIKIGREKGFVVNTDIVKFYQQSKVEQEMNKLIALGFFQEPKDCGSFVRWEFKK